MTNWSLYGIPAASDTIFIPGGPVDAPNWTFSDLRLNGGTIRGTFTIGGTLLWTAGALSGSITVPSNAVVNLAFTSAGILNGVLWNHGQIVWPAGSWAAWVFANGILENAADGSVDVQLDVALLSGLGGVGQVNNAGVIRKSGGGGGGTSTFGAGVSMQNTGLLDLQGGRLDFNGGFTSSGTFNVTNGAALNLNSGTFHFQPGHQFTGGGDYGVLGGNAIIDGPITEPNFLLSGGTLTISNQITGTLLWGRYATLAGAPTIASNGVLKVVNAPGGFPVTLSGVLTNYGLFLWPTGTYAAIVFDNGRLENMPGALVDVQLDGGLVRGPAGPGVFNNAGTLRKSGGIGGSAYTAFQAGFVFNNTGLVEVQSGILNFTDGFTSSAPFSLATNTALELTGGTFHFQPGHVFNGPGTYGVYGDVVIDGPIAEPNFLLSGGTLTMTNQITGTLVWQSGGLSGAPTIATNGVVRYAAGSGRPISGVLTNYGLFLWPAGTYAAIIFSNGRLENMPGALVDMQVDGGFYSDGSSAQVNNAGVLRKSVSGGTGVFANGVGFRNTGLLDVQSGTMQLPGNSLLAGSRFNCGLNSASDYGRITFGGSAALSGTLSANLIGGFTPVPGTQFQIISSSGLNGGFTSLSLPNHFFVTNNANNMFLVVGSGGPAKLISPALAGTNFTFAFQSEAGQNYTVQRNDDLGTTNWTFVQTISGDGSLKLLVAPGTGIPQRFFRLQLLNN